jgi:hypothetical protein
VDPRIQRLNGEVRFRAEDPAGAARDIEAAADGYEGLYPAGECQARTGSVGSVEVALRDVNLDVGLLVAQLHRLAAKGSLAGSVEVSSFAGEAPERYARFVFEDGQTFIQRPVLWESEA